MSKNVVKGLSGLIMSSSDPDSLAGFYRDVLGIQLELRSHGRFGDHWECDFDGVHFAVLQKQPAGVQAAGQVSPIIPSFHVDDIQAFVDDHRLTLSYPVLDLGEGSFVGEVSDPDGNPIRLWMHKS